MKEFQKKITKPVGVDDEGVVVVQLLGHQLVLLSSLVLGVVIEAPGESDLCVVVDVTANLDTIYQ